MNSPDKNISSRWKHPLSVSLLRKHGYEKDIQQIIEIETASLVSGLRQDRPSMFSDNSAVPIEAIAAALNIRAARRPCPAAFSATLRQTGTGYEISHGPNQHYYRRRFSLAHEMGHLVLSRLAGPFSNRDLQNTKGQRHEEEIICDLFASALLIPKTAFESALDKQIALTHRDINSLAKRFKVSKSAVLRRMAALEGHILILWDHMSNPVRKKSQKAERIAQVYPFVSLLSKHYIPLYCTLDTRRFSPNIVLESFHSGQALSGYVEIKNLGSIAGGEYFVRNIPFEKWNEDLLYPNVISKPKHFFNMATFIET